MATTSTGRTPWPRAARAVALGCLLWPSIAPGAEARRLVPARGLVAYLEFDGLDAHAEAWKATAARAMLGGTPAGSMINELNRQLADRLLKALPGAKLDGDDLVAIQDRLIRSGFALGVHREADGEPALTLVAPVAGRGDARERFERLARFCLDPSGTSDLPAPTRVRGRDVRQLGEAGRPGPEAGIPVPVPPADEAPKAAVPAGPWLSWWVEGDDLVLVAGPTADPKGHDGLVAGVLDAIERKGGDASTHPGYAAASAQGGDIRGFEPDGLFFVEPGAMGTLPGASSRVGGLGLPGRVEGLRLPSARYFNDDVKYIELDSSKARPARLAEEVPAAPSKPEPAAEAPKPQAGVEAGPDDPLGLKGIGRVVGRWGFEGKALVSDLRVDAPRPRKGATALLDGPALRKDQLPPIPKAARSFAVGTFEPARLADRVQAALDAFVPDSAEVQGQVKAGVRDFFGLNLRDDVLARLGPTWAVCSISPRAEAGEGPSPADPVVLVALKDAEGFARALDVAASRFNAKIRELDAPGDAARGGPGADVPILALEALPAPARGYQLTSPAGLVAWLGGMRPTIRVGKGFVALASDPSGAGEALAAEGDPDRRWRPAGELARGFEGLPGSLTLLGVGDPGGGSWTAMIPALPVVVQTLFGLFDADLASNVLGLVGVPRPGGFRVRIAPAKVPRWDDLKVHLFPSVLAASVDDRGLRVVVREAFPFAPWGDESSLDTSVSWTGGGGAKQNFKFNWKKRLGR